MGKSIREVYGTVLAELGGANENIVVLDADLSGSTKSGIFGKAHPKRHFNMGIAESDMVATAAGLATTGKYTDLLAKYGVDAAGVVRGIERVLARKH